MQVNLRFSTANAIGSWAIREFTRCAYSHVDVVADNGMALCSYEQPVTMDGQTIPAGVYWRPNGYGVFSAQLTLTVPCTQAQQDTFWTFMEAQIGKPYDWIGILGILSSRDWRQPDSWFCSELVAAALEQSKIINPLSSPTNWISPRDVLMVAQAMGSCS